MPIKRTKVKSAEYLDYEDASEFLGLPVGTLYAMVSRNQIPFFRYGPRLVRFAKQDLIKWSQGHFNQPLETVSVSQATAPIDYLKIIDDHMAKKSKR